MLTNQENLCRELNLPEDTILWVMYHVHRYELDDLKKMPTWGTAKNVVLIDQEASNVSTTINFDQRIHLWDSTVSHHPRVHTYLFWFDWVNEVNNHLNLYSKLIHFKHKRSDIMFDALLGHSNPQRNFIRNSINNLPTKEKFLLGNIIASQSGKTAAGGARHAYDPIWARPRKLDQGVTALADPVHRHDPFFTLQDEQPFGNREKHLGGWILGGSYDTATPMISFNGNQTANISCFLPYKIYNDSWYSIVTETHRDGSTFYTEKTAKPLLAKRLFVMFNNLPNYLENLRLLGYKTFGSVIDESYDTIQDTKSRLTAAWQQVLKLMDMDPIEVYSKIEPIVEHNHKLFISTNWQNKMKQEIKDLLTTT